MKTRTWGYLLAVSSLLYLGSPQLAHAQDKEGNETYGYADKVPELPSGGGTKALAAAIRAHFRFPADAPRAQQVGTFSMLVIVTAKGRVARTFVYGANKGRIKPSVQAAAEAAARALPLLTPAVLDGQPVQYQFTARVNLTGQPDSPQVEVEAPVSGPVDLSGLSGEGSRSVEEFTPDKVYTYVEQMPTLPGGGGSAAILYAVYQHLVVPRDAAEGKVFVRFVVNAEGAVTTPAILKGVSPKTDAAVLAAVNKLPRFVPGKQNGRAVQVEFTLPVSVVQPTPPATDKK
ncbi:MAG: energy transducer TonB [Hymenobacter sp.]|nr:MAG: energy transducer TonB [Hymenobacter sp.]